MGSTSQFRGDTPWEDFYDTIEASTPSIRAIGVTDYYLTGAYEQVRQARDDERLPNVGLIFANIELRLKIGTMRGHWVNMHLLVSPEDPDHITHIRRLLASLSFRAFNEKFSCTPEDFVRLGYVADATIKDEKAALRHGVEQFKVDFEELRKLFDESAWARSLSDFRCK